AYAQRFVLSFGVTVLPDPPWQRLVELLQLAEDNGFEYGWTYDSHVLWQEPYPLLTLAAANTTSLRLGLNVTNPGTREPTVTASAFATLQDVTGGRMIMGIGRGDSARRVIGQKPTTVGELEPAMVSNHVFDVISKHDPETLPRPLWEYVQSFSREQYDYAEHSREGAKHGESVSDETCERFCLLGTPQQHIEKLGRLAAAGVDQ